MWIILLDHSDSMGRPFEARNFQFAGRVRLAEAESKLEEAKRQVLRQLRSLDASHDVALFGFTSTVSHIHTGPAGEYDEFARRLADVAATNGTDIAAALNHVVALDLLRGRPHRPNVLLITDGQSDLLEAKAAAQSCIDSGLSVNVLLIDPTDEGRKMAEAIAKITEGMWEAAATEEQLAVRLDEAARSYAEGVAQAERILQDFERGSETAREEVGGRAEVSFTAGYPPRVVPGSKYPMLVFIHLLELKASVERMLRDVFRSKRLQLATSSSQAISAIERGKLITVQPAIKDVFANPPRYEIVWLEDVHKLEFEISYAGEGGGSVVCSGFIDVSVDGLLIGQIPMSIAVGAESQPAKRLHVNIETAKMFSRIFASYAREDLTVVHACRQAYKALGVYLYVDRDDLLAGQSWRSVLAEMIRRTDLFQLYWSEEAAASENVSREWELAIEVGGERRSSFIRPCYWQVPMPAPPEQLKEISFGYLDISALRLTEGGMAEPEENAKVAPNVVTAVFPIIPLEGDLAPSVTAHIQEAMKRVVPFLETLVGLRYYPPPTLLVDEFTLRQVRSRLTVDKRESEADNVDTDCALKLIQSLALAFHVRRLEPEDAQSDDSLNEFYRLSAQLEVGDFKHVRQMCEYVFSHPVAEYLKGKDAFELDGRRVGEFEKAVAKAAEDPRWGCPDLDSKLQNLLLVAEDKDRAEVESALGGKPTLLKDAQEGRVSKPELAALLARFESDAFKALVGRYSSDFYRSFRNYETRLVRSRTFPNYVADVLRLWLNYANTALARRGDIRVEVGFSVPVSCLEKLQSCYRDLSFDMGRESRPFSPKDEPQADWSISLSNYCRAVEILKELVLNAINQPHWQGRVLKTSFMEAISTFGIFASAGASTVDDALMRIASKNKWPAAISLPGSHKVLLCTKAVDRYRSKLLDAGISEGDSDQMTEKFLVSTLVHEHFHGIIETGVDSHGAASVASMQSEEWRASSAINESLAAWTQRHFFRDDPTMFEVMTGYINSGEYPEWPYKGAEAIETAFKLGGLARVRRVFTKLREDPQLAQWEFETALTNLGQPSPPG
jgi:hypothetical protein